LSIYAGSGADEELLVRIARDSSHDTYFATDGRGVKTFEGELEALMTIIDHAARTAHADAPA
jgi:hypothetical protein